jgi:hypothetical protein
VIETHLAACTSLPTPCSSCHPVFSYPQLAAVKQAFKEPRQLSFASTPRLLELLLRLAAPLIRPGRLFPNHPPQQLVQGSYSSFQSRAAPHSGAEATVAAVVEVNPHAKPTRHLASSWCVAQR